MLLLSTDFTTLFLACNFVHCKPDFKYVGILRLECCSIATMCLLVTTKSDSQFARDLLSTLKLACGGKKSLFR